MKYMLDTNIMIYLMNHRNDNVSDRFKAQPLSSMGVSSITVAELEYGVAKSGSAKNKRALDAWLRFLHRPAFDDVAAHIYGTVRASLSLQGTPIGPLDTLIAAHALAVDALLVTNNVREFSRVQGLKIEDWTQP
jgi:tRNA(fMet)-specific endonuclease VapC